MSISIPLESLFKFELLVSVNVSHELDFELVPILTQNTTDNANPSPTVGDISTKNIELRSLDFPDKRVIKINLNDSLKGKTCTWTNSKRFSINTCIASSTTTPLFEAKDTTMDYNVSTQPHQSMSTDDHNNDLAQNILSFNDITANKTAGADPFCEATTSYHDIIWWRYRVANLGLDSSIDFSKILQVYLDGTGFKEQTVGGLPIGQHVLIDALIDCRSGHNT